MWRNHQANARLETEAQQGKFMQGIMGSLYTLKLASSSSHADGNCPFQGACMLICEMLFLPKSQPIHKQLLSGLLQVNGKQQQETVTNSLRQQVTTALLAPMCFSAPIPACSTFKECTQNYQYH